MRHYKRVKAGRMKKYQLFLVFGFVLYLVYLVGQTGGNNATFVEEMRREAQSSVYLTMVRQYMPAVSYHAQGGEEQTLSEFLWEKMAKQIPVLSYTNQRKEYDSVIESTLSYEEIVALEGRDEKVVDHGGILTAAQQENESQVAAAVEDENAMAVQSEQAEAVAGTTEVVSNQPLVQIPREKLNDFDYLIQNFYQVDNTTTIDGSLLNAEELLAKDLTLTTPSTEPQILIYHTHSQEFFADSNPNDVMTGVFGIGEYLTQLLTEKYGFCVLHHMGQYDVGDRDHAYANAENEIARILEENPSIEVVIDLHRDAVDKHMVRNVNGVDMAPIMFFNGLSRTKALGDIAYLDNPNLSGNLAFSLQMQVAAAEYYPNLTRPIYLKGYRYNMHFREKTLLVEMGSYTNTQEEARNAMVPLADLLDKVLHGKM